MIWQRMLKFLCKRFNHLPKEKTGNTMEIEVDKYEEMNLYIRDLENVLESNMSVVDKMKSSFLQNIYHEIRTPLNAILGFTSLLVHVDLPTRKKNEYLNKVKSSSGDFLKIIDNLVDASLLETDQIRIESKRIPLSKLMTELEEYTNQEIKALNKKNITVKVDIDKQNETLEIQTDKYRLLQVFYNLLDNAIKFTEKGCIELGYRKINNSNVLFFVKDSGIGLQDDTADSIFDAFARYQHNELYDKRGLGLGLSICKGMVELMQGEIWVESNQFKGSVFNFALPLEYNNKRKQIPNTQKKNVKTNLNH
jgi:two-component system CheB/CheR fusion protein